MAANKRIFLGLGNTAGIFTSLKKGFFNLGIKADFYSFTPHIFGYKSDKRIIYSNIKTFRILQKLSFILKLLFRYDYFIFDSTGSLLKNFLDVKILRFFGKKTMVIFTGCDVRLPDKVTKFKWNPCSECTQEYQAFVGCVIESKPQKIRSLERVYDIIICPEEAAGSLSGKFFPALFPVSLNDSASSRVLMKNKINIIHAPSNENYKGTKYINEAISRLKKEFDFNYKVINNVTHNELMAEIASSDLVIDQMLVGYYGLLSIEAMSLERPVVCYIRDDLWKKIKHECPIYNANPDTLYDILKGILNRPEQLVEVSKNSRRFVEKYHDSGKIAGLYYDIFEKS